MLILNEKNLAAYIRENLLDEMGLAPNTGIEDIAVAGGGLVSAVFKAGVGGETLYFKQAIPGRLDKVGELMGDSVPEEAFVVYYDDRQLAEVKALRIAKEAVADHFVPTVYLHDAANNIIVMSEVCNGTGVVLADVMNDEIHAGHARMLGENLARIANYTCGKFERLRDARLEAKLKEVKYRYEVRDVWENINPAETRSRVIEKVSAWVSASSAMKSVLVHGDFHDRNIIVCGDRCGTYDLEECHWGDPVEDIGKLTASYILRMIYFERIRSEAYDAAVKLVDAYLGNLTIPESARSLEKRMRVMVAGCLLMRVDGISSLWLPWVHNELQKEITRQLAVKLVLEDDHYPLVTLLKQAFSDL